MFTRNLVARRPGRMIDRRCLLATAITVASATASAAPTIELGKTPPWIRR